MRSPDERIVALLQEARLQLEVERNRRHEPIAIVGVGCRFPGGAASPAAFWRLLQAGFDAMGEVPAERWSAQAFYDPDPEVPGKAYTKRGSFLSERIDGFDAEFFGISPREAVGMDPQQRLLLEVVWEALEDAGIAPARLRGSATGVWVGLCLDDYARLSTDSAEIDAYNTLGNTRSIAAGRISYVLDLRGPAVQLDTACSSSLVAIHQACQSLRSRECDLGLVGGVNLMLAPDATIALCKLRALAADGYCKTFDASADGYGRGEGCGMVVLKRLADAEAAGDRVYAVVRGSACNHDGHSNGLTAPSGVAQEAVIRAALVNAGVDAASVGYVEAHGTGTLLGDPIEVLALHRVYGQDRTLLPRLYVGAVKTNFGHLEAAAGIAGLIKLALCLAHGELTPHLHVRHANPKIPWDRLPIEIVKELMPWPSAGRSRIGGVSSFGISGTNAHVLLEEAPSRVPRAVSASRSAELVVLSARTPDALVASASRLAQHVAAHPQLCLADLAYSLLTTRSSMDCRLPLAVPSRDALIERLREVTEAGAAQSGPSAANAAPRVAFVFPGQGSQWVGMGQQLLLEEPVFRDAILRCERAVQAETGWSVLAELMTEENASQLDRVDVVQPVLFSFQVALAALWRSWGVEPDAVVGHSLGEVAAAVVAGALSLEDGAAVACRRSLLLRRISGRGGMALVELSIDEAKAALSGFEDRLSVAVSNGTRSTVLSGEPAALASVLEKLERRGVFCRRVKVDVASHSPQVDGLLDELILRLADVRPQAAHSRMHSTVSGAVLQGPELGARYWADNLRQPVRFASSVESLLAAGFALFLEVSPHPLLVTAVEQIRRDAGAPGVATSSLRRGQPERLTLLESLGVLHAHGLRLDAERLFPAETERVALPTYAWQKQRFWLDRPSGARRGRGAGMGHPLLGERVHASGVDALYEVLLSSGDLSWLGADAEVTLGWGVIAEFLRAAAEDHARGSPSELAELAFHAPLVLSRHSGRRIQVAVTDQGTRASLSSCGADASASEPWTLHATSRLMRGELGSPPDVELALIRKRCSEAIDVARAYEPLEAAGTAAVPAFRALRRLWRGSNEILAELSLGSGLETDRYILHPALLDASLHVLGALVDPTLAEPREPAALKHLVVHRRAEPGLLVHLRLLADTAEPGLAVDLTWMTVLGVIVAEAKALRLEPARGRRADVGEQGREVAHELVWRLAPPLPQRTLAGRWRIVAFHDSEAAALLVDELRRCGADSDLRTLDRVAEEPHAEHVLCVWDTERTEHAELGAALDGLAVVHSLVAGPGRSKLWWVTQSAVAIAAGDVPDPAGAALWGLGRTVQMEHPSLSCSLVDLPRGSNVGDMLARELGAADGESQVAWRAGRRHIARLARREPGPAVQQLRTDGTVLLVGGLSSLGIDVARAFARQGFRQLVLVGEAHLSDTEASLLGAELESLGARATLLASDLRDGRETARWLAAIPEQRPLRVVVHVAPPLADRELSELTAEQLVGAVGPHVAAAQRLHAATEGLDLDLFLFCCSSAGLLGSIGKGASAAVDVIVDALICQRRARGLAAVTLALAPPRPMPDLIERALERATSPVLVARLDLRAVSKVLAGSIPSVWKGLLRPGGPLQSAPSDKWLRETAALPSSERLRSIAEVVRSAVARVLSLATSASVPMDRPLKDLGFDSLMALELRNHLLRSMGGELISSFGIDPSLSTISSITERLLSRLAEPGSAERAPSFVADAILDPNIVIRSGPPASIPPRCVLLTGATGFLGAFLLAELLAQTQAEVICLVRGASVEDARRRLEERLTKLGLWRPMAAPRIRVVLGDLAQPQLGLDSEQFLDLANRVDAIYNNGAHVSYVAAYEELRASHVGATTELLRLASLGRVKTMQHISSVAAYDSLVYRKQVVTEATEPLEHRGIYLPYSQCKWATDALVRSASAQGLPTVIYRPHFIGGSSVNGAWNTDDFLCRVVKGTIEMGAIPSDLDVLLDFAPADYVARGIVHLSIQPSSIGRAFHLHHPHGITIRAFSEILLSLGYAIRQLSYRQWVAQIESQRETSLYALLPFLRLRQPGDELEYVELHQRGYRAEFDCDQTWKKLAEAGIECADIDADLIASYLRYLADIGFVRPRASMIGTG